VSVPDPPDRGYDEHRARAVLADLLGSSLRGIRIVTLDDLRTTHDGREFEADLAIELRLEQRGDETTALFAWAVNFGIEQLCVWKHRLEVVWPRHANSPSYEVPTTWPGWPHGRLVATQAFKLRASELGLNRADLRFEEGGFRIKTGGLSGDDVTSLLLSPLD
jgi:hypothetical protein